MSGFCKGEINENRQVFVDIEIASTEHKKSERVSAIVDTGANVTCITSKLAEKLNLRYMDSVTTYTASGKEEKSKVWLANLRIILVEPKGHKEFRNFYVTESGKMLLGMDIIEQGELYIKDRHFALRF